MLSPARTCYDVKWYDLKVKVDPRSESISGSNLIRFHATAARDEIQIDFFEGMNIENVELGGKQLEYRREFNAVFLKLNEVLSPGENYDLNIRFSGRPSRAKNAPWDGGFVWTKDNNGKPWVGVACEGFGASSWWPMKDHLSDEPDSVRITITAPEDLMAVANGNLRSTTTEPGWKTWEWAVTYPINSYNVTLNIADYAHIHDTYTNSSGTHDLDYYVLSYNRAKAEAQFKQVEPMMRCFEKYFGEYPFWRDGYALVETPYLGMEHQGAIAYGNEYMKGYAGYDPLALGFDYIVIHESGHEWWGNSVSTDDHAELWIHEGFCTYAEAVYVECKWNYETAIKYLVTQRGNISNFEPIVGPRDVNYDKSMSSDMYYKGAWMLHSLRGAVNNDSLWWATVYSFASDFKYKVTNTAEVIQYFNQKLGKDFTSFFRQYLYQTQVPEFEYKLKKKGSGSEISYRWNAMEPGFSMPLELISTKGASIWLDPTAEWKKAKLEVLPNEVRVNTDKFYVRPMKLGK